MPRVMWKPYLVSPSRTPYFDHGSHGVPLLTSEHHLEGDTVTALAIMDNSAQYPYDAGYYLYSKKAQNDPDNFTENALEAGGASTEESVTVVTVVQYVYTNMWFWWKEIFLISILTAIMMNVLITRHEMNNKSNSSHLIGRVSLISAIIGIFDSYLSLI